MNKSILVGIVLSIACLTLLVNPQDVSGLKADESYVIMSEQYFVVLNIDEDNKVSPIDGGVFYNGTWQMLNMTDVLVEQLDDKGDIGWIIGKLKSGEDFWFTWNLTINFDVVTGAWVYDGLILTEMTDYKSFMTRLFI